MSFVVVVEDNPDNRLLMTLMLEEHHWVHTFANGPAALAGIGGTMPDVVLMDISMPGMDGIEVLRRIRSNPRLDRVPVIALTAHNMAGDRERFLAAGFDGFVSKPVVEESILIDAINQALRHDRRMEAATL